MQWGGGTFDAAVALKDENPTRVGIVLKRRLGVLPFVRRLESEEFAAEELAEVIVDVKEFIQVTISAADKVRKDIGSFAMRGALAQISASEGPITDNMHGMPLGLDWRPDLTDKIRKNWGSFLEFGKKTILTNKQLGGLGPTLKKHAQAPWNSWHG